MKRLFTYILLVLLSAATAMAARIEFAGSSLEPISETPDRSSGLTGLYVLPYTTGVTMTYTATSGNAAAVRCSRFTTAGTAYAEPIDDSLISRSGSSLTISSIEGDAGYMFEEASGISYYWIVDYSHHECTVNSINFADVQDCSGASLTFGGDATRISYHSVTGRSFDLDRGLEVAYNTLAAAPDDENYHQITTFETFKYFSPVNIVPAPLCDTYFTLDGDKFQRTWGTATEVTLPFYTAVAVDAQVTVTQTRRDNDNEIKVEDVIGGSAPVEVRFFAIVSDAAVFSEWEFSSDPTFEQVDMRIGQHDYTHTFRDMGTTYVRFVAANADATCEYTSETYTISIGESRLRCPNAFSPGASEGVNDIWKVSYKSLVSFECSIFNRWGVKMTEFRDPSQGWDGKYKGKLVPPGVYYYVIKARGADGKHYNLSGDINILRYK